MSLKDFLKHPKTRRIIAVEWLVLVSFVCVSAAIALFVEMPRKLDKYWENWSAEQEEQRFTEVTRRIEQLSNALLKADKAGNVDDARMFANEIVRLRQEQPTANTEPTAPHESGSAKKSRRSTADTFKALWFALSESFATAALAGVLFGVLGYLAAWFPRFTFRAIRVVLANRPPP